MTKTKLVNKQLLLPVLMGFFIMGFCDLIAPISGHIAKDFPMQQSAVSFLPTMVFLWFLILSIPIASLMNKIGRKQTAIIGYTLSVIGLLVPYIAGGDCSLTHYFIGFGLLGIGNTFVQVAVNPLLATIVPSKVMTSYLTVGQIFRNTSLLLLAPMVTILIAHFGSWRLILPIYAALTVVGGIWLQLTTVSESKSSNKTVGVLDCFKQLKNPVVAMCAAGIACFIAADVGIGFTSSRLIDNPNSILTITGFYAFRIVGTIFGAYILTRISDVRYLRWNMLLALLLCAMLLIVNVEEIIYLVIGVLGFSMACVFATFYAVATKNAPNNVNEVAGLMIMAISAGAISGPVVGLIIQTTGVAKYGLVYVIACIAYLIFASFKIKIDK